MLISKQLRQKYLDFFVSKGHKVILSASLVPENDPTVLFTTAGMHPLVPYLLGEKHPEGKRLASAQKCARLQDIDEVGDNRHDTFFEMLGNWSLGDYFKKEAIQWSWEFLTDQKWLGLDPKKLAVSVFKGGKTAERDEESAEIWKEAGVPEHKICFLPKENNWWGPAGATGPCGPDTEMFYWMGESELPPKKSNPENDEDNWLEIWNDVFMEYNKLVDGSYAPLKQKNVDTGMGLERTLVALNGFADVFQVDTFWPLIQKIEEISGREYVENAEVTKSMRVIADHLRTATMIMGDDKGIAPSNVDQGYVVRRLIRRAVRHGRLLGIKENFSSAMAEETIKIFSDVYPEVERNREFVINEMAKEESKFRNTIERGMAKFEELLDSPVLSRGNDNVTDGGKIISAKDAFDLYQSYGFPIELTIELAEEKGLSVDIKGFNEEMKKHQELSRAGAEQKFKGGLADTGEMSIKYHTATHLLHAALRKVLGEHVTQRGSNITAERLRFDFSHPEKLTENQKAQIEELVNYAIKRDYTVVFEEMSVEQAKKLGAIGLFEARYGQKVKVYSVGDSQAKVEAHENSQCFSREICGGPHVEHTGVLGKFRIIKEEAVSAGVRRIKAILE
ncbi:alanine--tRNA ligase [Patescibacteria group bacterium]|nr:MAG: alanine--tRNA ligase [Patescibacteria group bacterium]